MILRNILWKKCDCCGHHEMISDAIYVCDECEKELMADRFNCSIFYEDSGIETKDISFCSWACLIKYLKNIKKESIDFISLPYLGKENLDEFLSLESNSKL